MIDQRNMGRPSRSLAVAAALTLYAVWTCATWLLEGRIETLLRPRLRWIARSTPSSPIC
jgi:hypothetical protein